MAFRVSHAWIPCDLDDLVERAAWGSLRMAIDASADEPEVRLTEADDLRAQTVRDDVVGALAPLADWLSRKWLVLFRSPRTRPREDAPRAERYEWERSHCLRFVGDGSILPDITIEPVGPQATKVSWRTDRGEEHRPLRFLAARGSRTLVRAELEEPLAALVDGVLSRLRLLVPDAPATKSLADHWARARTATHPDYAAARLAALAGLDWSLLEDAKRSRWREHADRATPLFEHALSALPPDQPAEAEKLANQLVDAASAAPHDPSWSELRALVGEPGKGLPWDVGWQCAHRFRDARAIPHDTPVRPIDLETHTTAADVESAVAVVDGRAPVRFVAAPRKDSAFRRTRDLWPVLFGRDEGGVRGAVVSPRSEAEHSVARAFSCELLAPIASIRSRLGGNKADEDDISWLAEELDHAPETCVRHQLENHRLLSQR